MLTVRRSAATLAVAGAGAAVMFLQWWAPLVALPALVLAAGLDPDVRSERAGRPVRPSTETVGARGRLPSVDVRKANRRRG